MTGSARFEQTRALIRIALNDGMTQDQIARECRTTQSTVSKWANGKALAKEHQLETLLQRYGHRLDRTASRIYRVRGPRPTPFEESPEGATLAELRELFEEVPAPTKADPDATTLACKDRDALGVRVARMLGLDETRAYGLRGEDLESLEEALREDHARAHDTLVQVEGAVVFTHTFEHPDAEPFRNAHAEASLRLRWRPTARWTVHRAGPKHFRLVRQHLGRLHGTAAARWVLQTNDLLDLNRSLWSPDGHRFRMTGMLRETRRALPPSHRIFCRDDAGRWEAIIEAPVDLQGLLAHVDRHLREDGGPHDHETVPYLVRRALLLHGHDVPGVQRLGPGPG